ncbi:hypothetical protein ABZP36_010312 [Zizania latifolia]
MAFTSGVPDFVFFARAAEQHSSSPSAGGSSPLPRIRLPLAAAAVVLLRYTELASSGEVLKYAFAEVEESRGAIQPAKTIYEALIAENASMAYAGELKALKQLLMPKVEDLIRTAIVDAGRVPRCQLPSSQNGGMFLYKFTWQTVFRTERGSDVIIVLVGNKTDLVDKR